MTSILTRIRRNPVLVGMAVLWGAESLGTGDPLTWRTILYVVAGVVIRSKVVPVNEVILANTFDEVLAEIARAREDAEKDAL